MPVLQQQGLTSARAFYPMVTHTVNPLPSWHPCAKMHGHDVRIAVVMNWPAPSPDTAAVPEGGAATVVRPDGVAIPTDSTFSEFETALHLIERDIRETRHLNELGGITTVKADWTFLARYVHTFISIRLPEELTSGLSVIVEAVNLRARGQTVIERWPEPEASTYDPVVFPLPDPVWWLADRTDGEPA